MRGPACRTLIDSTPGVLSAWAIFAREYGFNADEAAHASHGRRLYDTLKEYCHITDEATLHVSPKFLGYVEDITSGEYRKK